MDEESNEEDQTSEETGEETQQETKTNEAEKKGEKSEENTRRSEIAQKIKYREKYQTTLSEKEKLEAELTELRGAVKKPIDDAEAKAQEYIRKQAREVYEELQSLKQKEESSRLSKFESEVESIIDENPDISETELLDAIEEYEVEPKTALKILRKQENRAKKPKMPIAKRGTSESNKEKPDDSKKSMWEILKEETSKLKSS